MTERECCSWTALRERAFKLADTGKYRTSLAVARAIEEENCPGAIARIGADKTIAQLLDQRCEAAKKR